MAWTETVMTLAEDDAGPVDDLNYYLRRQEIFASMLISGTWTTPQRLTNDLIPDGRAALAGDATHLRLAWTRDLDGDITTRGDTRIATTDWRDDATGWRAFELLAAPTISATTSNSQVSVALAPPGQIGDHLAWTVDLDANLDTNGDRYLAWANNQSGAWNTAVLTEAQHMPAGIDSPSIDFDPLSSAGTPQFAFIVRTQDSDGVTDTGIGNQGRLWRAYSDLTGLHSEPVMDGPDFIYAEKPLLRSTPQGRTQLIFRRFGAAGTLGALGQLALAVSPSSDRNVIAAAVFDRRRCAAALAAVRHARSGHGRCVDSECQPIGGRRRNNCCSDLQAGVARGPIGHSPSSARRSG